jgi:hypothetical protein
MLTWGWDWERRGRSSEARNELRGEWGKGVLVMWDQLL